MSFSAVIPYRNEPLLDWTVENVLRIAPDAEILTIEDVPIIGNSYRRHEGIVRAKNDSIILLDAHMDFSNDCFSVMMDHLRENPTHISCVNTTGLDKDLNPGWNRSNFGAFFLEWDGEKAFVSKWRNNPGPIQTVLGACYGLSRDWYLDGLGGPWQFHRGWGKSEQILSITNFMCGGENVCLSQTWAAHLFRKVRPAATCSWMDRLNQTFILNCLCSDVDRDRVHGYLKISNPAPSVELMKMGAIEYMQKHMDSHMVRTYADFLECTKMA